MEEVDEVTAPWYVWAGLTVVAAVSFWCQAVVTEERYVGIVVRIVHLKGIITATHTWVG